MARTAIHPGEHLAEQLKELGMSAAGDSALRLAHFFGTSAEFWLNLQKLYELRLAEQKAGAVIRGLPRLANRRNPKTAGDSVAPRNWQITNFRRRREHRRSIEPTLPICPE